MGTLLLGEIESALLQGYFGELRTKEVVVTEERMEHIRERHPQDVETDREDRKNSVMTFYRIRERNLKKLMEKNRLLYSRE